MKITKEIFEQQRRPRFGNANPERMRCAFWEWMIRGNDQRLQSEEPGELERIGLIMREGKLKSSYGPYRARDLFNVPLNREDGPIWTFDRMGSTGTELPDGQVVCIGGEHEDSYDPDFCIYNDVVVFGPDDQIAIFGYPKEIFPPTDFHTATLAGDQLIIVGSLGYRDDRQPGHTPVYAVRLSDYRISKIEVGGEGPGWVFKHTAELTPKGIVIRGGEIFEEHAGKRRYRRNIEDYVLDLSRGEWHRLTTRNWRQFYIRQEDGGLFVLEQRPEAEALLPRGIKHRVVRCKESSSARFLVRRVPVSLTVRIDRIEVMVEGNLSEELCTQLAEELRANAEECLQCECVLDWV